MGYVMTEADAWVWYSKLTPQEKGFVKLACQGIFDGKKRAHSNPKLVRVFNTMGDLDIIRYNVRKAGMFFHYENISAGEFRSDFQALISLGDL